MKTALKEGRKADLGTLRSLRAQIKDAQIRKGRSETFSDDDVIKVLTNAAKKRKEAVDMYQQAKRTDLVEKEQSELRIIERYLPEQLSDDDINRIIDEVIQNVAASSVKDLGKVMGAVMPKVKGKADGKKVQSLARERLIQIEE